MNEIPAKNKPQNIPIPPLLLLMGVNKGTVGYDHTDWAGYFTTQRTQKYQCSGFFSTLN